MSARNGEDTPAMPTRRRADVLDDGEDVAGVSDRDLVLRAVNSTIATEEHVGKLLSSMARIEGDVREIKLRLAPNGEIEQRQRQTSNHAIEGAADTIAAKLLAEFHGPRGGTNNLTREAVVEVVTATLGAERLRGFEQAAKDRKKLRMQIVAGVVVGLIVVAATAAAGHFEGRASAPAVQGHP